MATVILNNISDCWVGNNQAKEIWCSKTKIWPTSHDYSRDYLTFTSLEDNNSIGWKADNSDNVKTISVSTDNGITWTDKTSSVGITELAVLNTGQKLLIKGNNTGYSSSDDHDNRFTSTNNFDVSGNIMSLIYMDGFINQTTLQEDRTFRGMFRFSKVVYAHNLVLPALTLTEDCYVGMFYQCTNLITAPKLLPALTLAWECYAYMFYSCNSLTHAPSLPATTLDVNCYGFMFHECALTHAPSLPATTLVDLCYNGMFANCESLNYIKCLATDISAANCLASWVENVSNTGTFVKNANTTIPTGINGIPEGWTVQNI